MYIYTKQNFAQYYLKDNVGTKRNQIIIQLQYKKVNILKSGFEHVKTTLSSTYTKDIISQCRC